MVLSRTPHATGETSKSQSASFQLDRLSAPQLFLYTKNAKNGEECEMRLLRGYGTRPRAAGNRRYTSGKSGLPELALLLSA